MNESVVLFVFTTASVYSGDYVDRGSRLKLGWVQIGVILVFLVVNIFMMMKDPL